MNYELIIWITGLMLFAYWLNYVFGSPLADGPHRPDPGAILASFPRALAWRRLRKEKLADEYWSRLQEMLGFAREAKIRRQTFKDWQLDILEAGRVFFTWERTILCPVCFHFWATVIFGVICLSFNLLHARQDLLLAGFTYLLNHFFIRKIS